MAQARDREDTLEYFLGICGQFKLGALVTEQPNPITANLSQLVQSPATVAEGLRALQAADVAALEKLQAAIPAFEELARAVDRVLCSGHSIVLEGCGATGRLSLSVEAYAHEGLVEPQFQNKIKGFMAGGDAALIRSIEKFEDRVEYGERQLHDIGFSDGDLLLAITEGGETPFVIAACEEALKVSHIEPYFLYCNPDDILCRVADRSKRIIENPKIHKINLCVGPMSITGSTRMQATTVQLACAGLAIQHHKNPSRIREDMEAFFHCVKALDYGVLAPFTTTEAEMFRSKEHYLYESPEFGVTTITDTTERAPTFSLAPFENYDRPTDATSAVYLHVPNTKTPMEAWNALLTRPPRPLEWEQTAKLTGAAALNGFDFSDQILERRAQRCGKSVTQCYVTVSKMPQGGMDFCIHRRDTKSILAQVLVALPPKITASVLLHNLAAKVMLNAHSTAMMGILGRYEGNIMTWVRPSNYKLIDRAARYVDLLLKRCGPSAVSPAPTYVEIVTRIFSLRDSLGPDEPIVLKVLHSFTTKQ